VVREADNAIHRMAQVTAEAELLGIHSARQGRVDTYERHPRGSGLAGAAIDASDSAPETPPDKGRSRRSAPGTSSARGGAPVLGADNRTGKGLRHFSSLVCQKVEEKGRTTYNEVADELVAELTADGQDAVQMDEKNIRRRVYDALNVLMAMEIIDKEKKEIFWKGLPNTSESDVKQLRDDCRVRLAQLDKKRKHLDNLVGDFACLHALAKRNASQPAVAPENRLQTPFVVIYTLPQQQGAGGGDEGPVIEMSEDSSEVLFDFKGRGFQVEYDKDILQQMELGQVRSSALGGLGPAGAGPSSGAGPGAGPGADAPGGAAGMTGAAGVVGHDAAAPGGDDGAAGGSSRRSSRKRGADERGAS